MSEEQLPAAPSEELTGTGSTEHVTESSGPGFTESISTPGFTETVYESSDASFGKSFSDCMGNLGLPAPNSLFATAASAIATIKAIHAAIAAYGTEVTIAELIGAGVLSDALVVAGALTASFYAGACAGCVVAAGIDWATS